MTQSLNKQGNPIVRYESIRGWFAYELYKHMEKDKRIYLLLGDLGYKFFDEHLRDFPDRAINCGSAEIAMLGAACGLALEGKIPFVYSITTFLLYRPFESIRNYIDYEKIPVKLIGSGRDKDYTDDGISHWNLEDKKVMRLFPSITSLWPKKKEQIPSIIKRMISDKNPYYLNLQR